MTGTSILRWLGLGDGARNVTLLTLAQAFSASGSILMTLLAGIIGSRLAPHPGWATLGVTVGILMLALTSLPAALLMQRVGRRAGFVAGALVGVAAGLLAAYAVTIASFTLFCAAMGMVGVTMAFAAQYRFAAAESVEAPLVSRAVSFVMIGTLAAAVVGPQAAVWTRTLLPGAEYAATYLALSVFYLCAIGLLLMLKPTHVRERPGEGSARPLAQVIAQPALLLAMLVAAVGWGVMSFIMTATPISMHVLDGHSVEATAWVIQSHVIAMYLPSLASGWLIARLGLRTVMTVGLVCMFACLVVAVMERHVMHYWWALVLLGVGWNFLFVGGTTLLATSHRSAERFRVQAVNEFVVFGTTALASLLAGVLLQSLGWETINLLMLPLLALTLVFVLRSAVLRRSVVADAAQPGP
ncbi:MAG: MFS transporter [Gammaproteobacteria bacterium]|nr:MFS transporter [Gammaproteobacteria bacterium]